MKIKILALLAVMAALVVAGCGGSDKPGNAADRAFVAEMVPHHESALEMATIARQRGTTGFVKTLSANIVRSQSQEIRAMRTEDATLAKAGVEKGDLGVPHSMMGMSMDNGMLKTANPFDPAFLKMMIPHHEGALVMAKAELKKGSDPKLKKLATQIIAGQQKEITQMKSQLGRLAS
ncbi:MAG: DUF305 domain-containing protein [Solirubrobacteraceae bacterium]